MPDADSAPAARVKVCFLGATRYRQPLDSTSRRKFRALAELGEMSVIGFSAGVLPRRFREHARFYLLPNLPTAILRYAVMTLGGTVLALWAVARHGVWILVTQSPQEGLLGAAVKLGAGWFGRRIVLIVESHGDFERSLFPQRGRPLPAPARALWSALARISLRQADLLRAVSAATKRQLAPWAGHKPVAIFPAWTDLDAFLQAGGAGEPAPGEVLYAGVIGPQKGIHHLIRAFSAVAVDFPAARLTIAGAVVNRRYAGALYTEVRSRQLDERVRFIPHQPQDRLARRMGEAAVLVLPSLSEGLGRVVIEAMAAGCPVVASHVGGIPEIVQDGRTGLLVPPGDEGALAEAIRWMLSHPEQAREMGRRGRALAPAYFSAERYLAGYAGLFAQAAEMLRAGDGAAAGRP